MDTIFIYQKFSDLLWLQMNRVTLTKMLISLFHVLLWVTGVFRQIYFFFFA